MKFHPHSSPFIHHVLDGSHENSVQGLRRLHHPSFSRDPTPLSVALLSSNKTINQFKELSFCTGRGGHLFAGGGDLNFWGGQGGNQFFVSVPKGEPEFFEGQRGSRFFPHRQRGDQIFLHRQMGEPEKNNNRPSQTDTPLPVKPVVGHTSFYAKMDLSKFGVFFRKTFCVWCASSLRHSSVTLTLVTNPPSTECRELPYQLL